MKFVKFSNGALRMTELPTPPAIYDQRLTVVSGLPLNSNEIQGPLSSGSILTLPQSGTYSGLELLVFCNGNKLEAAFDYNYVGSGTRTQIQILFDLVVNDTIDFRTERDL